MNNNTPLHFACTVRETRRGWINKHTGSYYQTATNYMRRQLKEDREITRSTGRSVVRNITWEPSTRVGTAVVRTLGATISLTSAK